MRRPRSWKARTALAAELSPRFETLYPSLQISLLWETPLELVVATVLSAQCTDARVNMVTRELFPAYPDAKAYADAPLEELAEAVRSTGFFNSKAKNLKGLGTRLVEAYDGEVPNTMADLLTLPGVARKTANVVLSNAFGIHEGVVVDTHVKRVAHRLGLTNETNPPKVEKDLMRVLPKEEWHPFSWRLIQHGRNSCVARKPRCSTCSVAEFCCSAGKAARP